MTAKRRGANGASSPITSLVAAMQAPAANSLVVSQRMALEAARFWARRMHSYANQMQTLAACTDVRQAAAAQTRFLEQMREDYAAESAALTELWDEARNGQEPSAERPEA